jgi:hypothetical protein
MSERNRDVLPMAVIYAGCLEYAMPMAGGTVDRK